MENFISSSSGLQTVKNRSLGPLSLWERVRVRV